MNVGNLFNQAVNISSAFYVFCKKMQIWTVLTA